MYIYMGPFTMDSPSLFSPVTCFSPRHLPVPHLSLHPSLTPLLSASSPSPSIHLFVLLSLSHHHSPPLSSFLSSSLSSLLPLLPSLLPFSLLQAMNVSTYSILPLSLVTAHASPSSQIAPHQIHTPKLNICKMEMNKQYPQCKLQTTTHPRPPTQLTNTSCSHRRRTGPTHLGGLPVS